MAPRHKATAGADPRMHRGARRQSVRSGSGNYSCHRQPALTGRQVISSGEWLEEDLRFDRFGGFLAQPERPRFRFKDRQHAVVKFDAQSKAGFPLLHGMIGLR